MAMLNIDLDFVKRLLYPLLNLTKNNEMGAFDLGPNGDAGILSQHDPFTLTETDFGFKLALKGEEDIFSYGEVYALERLSEGFDSSGFRQHLSVDCVYSYYSQFEDEDGDNESRSNWYLVIEDKAIPNTFLTLTLPDIYDGGIRLASDLEISIYPNLTTTQQEALLTAVAAKAMRCSLKSGEVHHMHHVLKRCTSSLIDKPAMIEQSRSAMTEKLATLFLAFKRSSLSAPILPEAVSSISWLKRDQETVLNIIRPNERDLLITFKHDHIDSASESMSITSQAPLVTIVREAYLYSQELAHETGQLTGELHQKTVPQSLQGTMSLGR